MNSLSSIALSGMSAAQMQLGASANNVANLLTPGFQRQTVDQAAVEGGGVSAQVQTSPVAGPDLPRDLVNELSATYAFKASAKVIEADKTMVGALLNMVA